MNLVNDVDAVAPIRRRVLRLLPDIADIFHTIVGCRVQLYDVEESPLCIECKVREIISLGSHDMFISDVVNILADDKYINPETGAFDMLKADLLVYSHGHYYEIGKEIGKFGWSVQKKK